MRYARQEDLQKLALLLQGSAEGLGLADIMREFAVSRRTAERMRDALRNAYPQVEEIHGAEGRKYWRFPPGALGRMVEPTLDELTAGHRAAAIARREGDAEAAEALERLLVKVKAMFRGDRRRTIAADLEAQLMADGVAFRPGPREMIAPEHLSALRAAILAGVMIRVDHRARSTKKLSRGNRLGPIAMLFGQGRQYLLAYSEYQAGLRLYALSGFEAITLERDIYTRPEGFDLEEWLAQSFGVWRDGAAQNVEWRFAPEVAEEAASYAFHPKQTAERAEDGALVVRFRAEGRQEMDWYLARWGDAVEARYSDADTPETDASAE